MKIFRKQVFFADCYICFIREEQEKLNIWVALMNLENMYGTQESLVKVFERALQQNEPKKVFLQLVDIYVRSNKMEVGLCFCLKENVKVVITV